MAIDLEGFDKLGREVPVLIDLKPSGEHYMEHFHHAGGVPKLLRELGDLLDLDVPTVAGGTLRDVVAAAEDVAGQDCHPLALQSRLRRPGPWRSCTATSRLVAR